MKTYKEVKIKVIGVGGAGCNAVSYMQTQHLKNVQLIACNTDAAFLSANPIQDKLLLHINPSDNEFTANDPESAKQAALDKIDEIKALLSDDTDIVFIVAGMGGSAGTGASPVIAQVAKKLGILTVGIVTTPFSFEGDKKAKVAAAGIEELGRFSDSLVVFSNNRLREHYEYLPIKSAFNKVDEHISHAVRAITEIVTVSAEVNVDVEDIRFVLENSGKALVGNAVVAGANRARLAAEQVTDFSLLAKSDMRGAKRLLLAISSGPISELEMEELNEITDFIQDKAGLEAEMLFGHAVDEELEGSIRVTLIAAGFSDN